MTGSSKLIRAIKIYCEFAKKDCASHPAQKTGSVVRKRERDDEDKAPSSDNNISDETALHLSCCKLFIDYLDFADYLGSSSY